MSELSALIAALPEAERAAALQALPPADLAALEFAWPVWARADQLPPEGAWRVWLLLGGRGSGKTRSSSEWTRAEVEAGRRRSIGIIGPTADTLRRDCVQGASGLIETAPPWNRPQHEPSQRRIVWPNGQVAHLLSSEEPDRIRGVNLDAFWGDELTSWAAPDACWHNLQLALRIAGPKGDAPRGVVSTTPKRHALLRKVLSDPATVTTRSRTSDNVGNLDPGTVDYLTRTYGGTTLGRQELDAELLDDLDGALWTRRMLDECRVMALPAATRRVVVAVDPAGGSSKSNAETGIIAVGLGHDGRGYVLADASGRYTPDGWGRATVNLYRSLNADRIVAERNFGGEMVEATIRSVDPFALVKLVSASRGKAVRAEPVVALYEQRRVSHVGQFQGLEDQLCGWDPSGSDPSPDRLDALVWALTELMAGPVAKPATWRHSFHMAR